MPNQGCICSCIHLGLQIMLKNEFGHRAGTALEAELCDKPVVSLSPSTPCSPAWLRQPCSPGLTAMSLLQKQALAALQGELHFPKKREEGVELSH